MASKLLHRRKYSKQNGGSRVPAAQQQLSPTRNNVFASAIDDLKPLGLKLRKTPSLLNLIQKLRVEEEEEDNNGSRATGACDPAVAASGSCSDNNRSSSKFPALWLRIGSWEHVAKCYFGKRKLVWEVDERSKIEIPWSDITRLRAANDSLTITLARKPTFYGRETRAHPWVPTGDFTEGQATLHKRHYIECPPGALDKHYEKLIQCDTRLSVMSRQPPAAADHDEMHSSPYFDDEGNVVTILFTDYWDAADERVLLRTVSSYESLLRAAADQSAVAAAADARNDNPLGGGAGAVQQEQEQEQEQMMDMNLPRQDSYGDLFHNLPRIASLPDFSMWE